MSSETGLTLPLSMSIFQVSKYFSNKFLGKKITYIYCSTIKSFMNSESYRAVRLVAIGKAHLYLHSHSYVGKNS